MNPEQRQHQIQLFKQILEEKQKHDLLQVISKQAKVSYVDPQKLYAIVEVKYLEELKDLASHGKARIEQCERKAQECVETIEGLKRSLQLKHQTIQKLEEVNYKMQMNLAELESKMQAVERENESKLLQNFELLEEISEHEKRNEDANEKIPPFVFKQNAGQQTEFSLPVIEFTKSSTRLASTGQHQAFSQSSLNEEQKKLKLVFQKVIADLQATVNSKEQELTASMIDMEAWNTKNRLLEEENEELKKAFEEVDEKKEKIQEWKLKLQRFMERIDNDTEEQPLEESQEHQLNPPDLNLLDDKERIKILERKLLEKEVQKKIAEERMKKVLEAEAEVADENVVNSLVAMSQRVKEVVNCMLHAI